MLAAAWLALLLVAPPGDPRAWAVNTLRALPPLGVAAVVLAAAACAGLALAPRVPAWPLAPILAAVLAFPLHERLHLLGDTWVRQRFLAFQVQGLAAPAGFEALGRQLHAQPLDNVLNVSGVLLLARAGVPLEVAIAVASLVLALVYFAGAGRLVSRLAPAGGREPLLVAFVLAGTLEAFAGYAESGGIVLAAGVWWWALMLEPLPDRRRAAGLAAAWLALFMSHRVALAMIVPHAWRCLGPPLEGDRPEARRWCLGLTAAAAALAVASVALERGHASIGRDLSELLLGVEGRPRLTPGTDVLDLVALVMPLAVLAPAFFGARAVARRLRAPRAVLHLVALVTLSPMVLVFPVAPHGLGAHRDWELAALAGLIASAGGVALLARLPAGRRRATLAVVLPLLALQAGGWLGVNADAAASERRAVALVDGPHALWPSQRSHALVFLGYLAANRGQDALAARRFDRAYRQVPNARQALLATESWLRAGDPAAASRSLASARARGPLPPELAPAAGTLQRMIVEAERGAASTP